MPRPAQPEASAQSQAIARAVRGHMPALDGLRGIAIALVVAHNCGVAQMITPSRLHKVLYLLHMPHWVGVHLFFVLSGFLITGILLDDKERPGSHARGYFRSFYVRRTLRIFPLYYAALTIAFLIAPHLGALPTPARTQVWYWTYLSNWVSPYGIEVPYFSHFWSLAVEEQFYLAWPLIVFLASRRALAWLCGALAVVALAVRTWLVVHHAPMFAPYELTTARMDALVLGALAAIIARNPLAMDRIEPHLARALAASAAAIVALAPFTAGFWRDRPLVQTLGHSILAILFTVILLLSLVADQRNTRWARVLRHPSLRTLGKYSYAIYVAHVPIERALRPHMAPFISSPSFAVAAAALVAHIAIVSTLSLGVALASWHLLEKRVLAWKDVLAPKRADTDARARVPQASG